MSSSGGKMSSKSPVPSLKKENAPPEIEIPPRYNTGTHVCYCCGKTRSKAYQSDHPIDVKIGAKPSLCGPCGYTIAVSGNLPGGLERKRAYLSGLHWCSTCGTLRSTKFHLNQQRHGPKSNLSEICGVYETLAEKEDTAPTARNSNRASQGDHDSPESAASCTSVDSPDPNYPSSDEEAPASRTLRPALRSILINTSTNDRDTGHSAGTAWVSKGASDSSSETRVHFTNPEISGLTEVPNYDRSPIELDYPEHASRPSPMIPSARRAQPAAEQPSTDSSSSPDSEPPHVLPRPVYKDGVPTGMGTTGSSTQDTATRGEVPKRGDTHHPEPSYRPVPAHNEQGNDRGSRWTTQEHNPMFDTSAPATDYRSSTEYLGSQTQGHHVKLPKDHPIQPLSGYCPSPPVEETISPLSGYCAPHVDDYCTTPSLDEPIHQQTSFPNSSTDTFGRPSPDITSEAPHLRSGNNHNSQTFAHPGPSQEEPVYDATFFAPSSTHSSQTLRPSTSREFSSQTLRPSTSRDFSTGPSPVFSSSSSRGPSPNTESSAGGGDHAFTSDAQRRAESEARMFAAAGYDMPMAEEAEMKEGSPSESKAWEVESEEAEEIEKEHIARMGGKYVNTSFQM
ncbi:hypothetical protein QBC39DRAFT_386936 [Podospora conica]|nr:hypothetical protein QBC39DRAFT_386936 [Schizothecium conicum]